MLAFLKQPKSNTRSTLYATWKNNLETFEKLFSMMQSLHLFRETITQKYSWTLARSAYSNEDYSALFFYKNQ